MMSSACSSCQGLQVLLMGLFLLLSLVSARPEGSGWSSSSANLPRGNNQQITNLQTQQGGLLPFPEGRGPDGTLYKTDYRCEGENMTVSCIDSDGPGLHGTIQVVRGNFGRFSIAICNRHGQTDWSVNCMAPQTTKVLQKQCDGGAECVVPVNSELFHDACPGTHKYLEIHYACLSSGKSSNVKKPSLSQKIPVRIPHWPLNHHLAKKPNKTDSESASSSDKSSSEVRKQIPILVTEKQVEVRVPITSPPPTSSSTTVVTTEAPTTSTTTPASTTKERISVQHRQPVNINHKPKPTTSLPVHAAGGINTLSSLNTVGSDVFVTPMTGALACQPVTARQLQWDRTPVGQVALQPCPVGATGLARWYCSNSESDGPQWSWRTPDMSDCKSISMSKLEEQVNNQEPENVIVQSLNFLTRTKALYGGDLEAATAIMRKVASRIQYRLQSSSTFHDKYDHIHTVVVNVLNSAANMLEDGINRAAWYDLTADRQMKVATSLMLALEENAFLLAGVKERAGEILETYETLTMAIKVAQVRLASDEEVVEFPGKPLLYVDDKISLAASDLEDNSQGGLGEAVFFSFRGLHEILSGAKTYFEDDAQDSKAKQEWRLNSRIISASLGRGRHIELSSPVSILLRHLDTSQDLKEPVCVFWDYEVHAWSDSGCRLMETNATYSLCQCDHLTNFALLMRPANESNPTLSNINMAYVGYIILTVILIVLVVVILKMRSKLKHWCQNNGSASLCCLNRNKSSDKDLRVGGVNGSQHLEKCQSFYSGLSQGGQGPTGPMSGGYHPTSLMQHSKKSRTLGGTHGLLSSGLIGSAHTTSRASYNSHQPLNSTPMMMMNSKNRPHITLNPYSTQLVDNLNMMMPSSNNNSTSNSSASTNSTTLGTPLTHNQLISPQLMNLTNTLRRNQGPEDVIYRSVSPHGHVYWEIDPNQIYNNNQVHQAAEESVALLPASNTISRPYLTSRHGQLTEEDLLLQQHLLSSNDQQMNGLHDSLHGLQHTNEQVIQPGMVMMATSSASSSSANSNTGAFVRTGATRFGTRKSSVQKAQPQVATVSASTANNSNQQVPEQLQTQVQIRDILPIQVSVKSSEYIEAKIRSTLRRTNHQES